MILLILSRSWSNLYYPKPRLKAVSGYFLVNYTVCYFIHTFKSLNFDFDFKAVDQLYAY